MLWTRSLRKRLFASPPAGRAARRPPRRARCRLAVDPLEDRTLPSAAGPLAPPVVFTPILGRITPAAGVGSLAGPGPNGGYIPSQLIQAYGFNKIAFLSGLNYNANAGKGQTIAIVDAYDDPNFVNSTAANFLSSDLHNFDVAMGLPDPPSFTKVGQTGTPALPGTDPSGPGPGDWETETALDIEWAHAIAPAANIVLVEANSASGNDLYQAVDTAKTWSGVSVVSMSWGGGEYFGETSDDTAHFLQSGVTFVAASGDSGAPPIYPAASPNVLAVGGTSLPLDTAGDYPGTGSTGEVGWNGSGGGLSQLEPLPSYQPGTYSNGSTTHTSTQRMNPDVSYDADPNTGFPVYDSYNNGTANPWGPYVWGGTSDAAPQWAALIAIVNQGRAQAGKSALNTDSTDKTLPMLYALSSSDFHDIVNGSSFGFPTYTAGPGYDLVTGRGSPAANLVVGDLIGAAASDHFSVSANPTSTTAGSSVTITVTAVKPGGGTDNAYSGTVQLTSSDGQAVLSPPSSTLTNGIGTFSVTLKTAGSQTVTATDTVNNSITGQVSVTVNPASASMLVFGQQPTNTTQGVAISPAVTVKVEDTFGNVVTSDSSTVTLTLSTGTFEGGSPTAMATASSGVATFSSLKIDTVGSYTLAATDGTLASATSNSFTISAAPASKLVFGQQPTNTTAGSSIIPAVTVKVEDASGNVVTTDGSTVTLTLSSGTFEGGSTTATATASSGVATFSGLKIDTAGNYTLKATDGALTSATSSSFTVSPSTAYKLAFGQQPTNTVAGSSISPAVTVDVLDQYGNLITTDNTDQVTMSIGTNPSGGTLSGANSVRVSGGVATFSNLSINKPGTGYTLVATDSPLIQATSSSFNITTSTGSTIIEDFETGNLKRYTVVGPPLTDTVTTAAAHDGVYGLDNSNGNDWIYRSDAAAQLKQGETISVWIKFSGVADGRAYFGFGASSTGTLSVVLAPNTNQLIIQQNLNYGFANLSASSVSYLPNHWYRVQVSWMPGGMIMARLFDSDGKTALAATGTYSNAITSGGIAFRAIGHDKYFDTVTMTAGGTPPALVGGAPSGGTAGGAPGAPVAAAVSGPVAGGAGQGSAPAAAAQPAVLALGPTAFRVLAAESGAGAPAAALPQNHDTSASIRSVVVPSAVSAPPPAVPGGESAPLSGGGDQLPADDQLSPDGLPSLWDGLSLPVGNTAAVPPTGAPAPGAPPAADPTVPTGPAADTYWQAAGDAVGLAGRADGSDSSLTSAAEAAAFALALGGCWSGRPADAEGRARLLRGI